MRTIQKLLFLIVLAPFTGVWAEQPATFDEGFEYHRISPIQPTRAENKIEVLELFWYGCPHCYRFEPVLHQWLEKKPDNVVFRRMPAVLRDSWATHARAYYAAMALGVLDKIHGPLFGAIHREGRKLNTEETLADFFAEHGVSREEFREAYGSFSVHAKLRRAISMSRRYQINGVPAMVVNGKYRTDAKSASIHEPGAPSNENMLKVVDYLIQKESMPSTAAAR